MQPVLMPIIGIESGDRWILTGVWDGKEHFELPWTYEFQYKDREFRLRIPLGFKADGASVPWIVTPIARMRGRAMPDEAWLPHDYFYHCRGEMKESQLLERKGEEWLTLQKVDRGFVDQVFYSELKKEKHGLASFKAPLAYRTVKWFGGRAWRT